MFIQNIFYVAILPFSTAECERGFSVMNRLKSKDRNRLREILESLMILNTKKDHEFDWIVLEKKLQRIFKYEKN